MSTRKLKEALETVKWLKRDPTKDRKAVAVIHLSSLFSLSYAVARLDGVCNMDKEEWHELYKEEEPYWFKAS